jgi:DNA-binding transcriptional ArsR family regulator
MRRPLNERTIELVAERFRILGDPMRLRLLQILAEGERSVAELVEASGASQANVSKHLQLMLHAGVLERRKEGLFVYYAVRDPRVFELCDLVCGSLADVYETDLSSLGTPPRGRARKTSAGRKVAEAAPVRRK